MLQWHSVIFYNLTRAPFNLKLSPNCWQPSWAPVVQAELRRCRTSFLWHMERASRQCWLLCFVKVPGNGSARVSVLSRTNTAHLQPIISAAFCHLPGSKQVVCKVAGVGGATDSQLLFSWPFLFLGICVSVRACSWTWAVQCVFCIPGAAQSEGRQNHSCVLRYLFQLWTYETLKSTWLEYILNQSMKGY